jgi:hypothetical protein
MSKLSEALLKVAGRLEPDNRLTDRSAMFSEHLADRLEQTALLRVPPLLDPQLDALVNSLVVLLPPSSRIGRGPNSCGAPAGRTTSWGDRRPFRVPFHNRLRHQSPHGLATSSIAQRSMR